MSSKGVIKIIFGVFIIVLLGVLYYFRASFFNKNEDPLVPPVPLSEAGIKKEPDISVDRITTVEDSLTTIESKQEDTDTQIEELSKKVDTLATPDDTISGKDILATAQTKGTTYTSASTVYSSMGMFVNITCPQKCVLWINFYSSSKNLDTPASLSSNVNSYGIFLNNAEQSIYSQASIPSANSSVPVSLNAAMPVAKGTYTVDIRAKTSAGTLQSDISFLQVMAISD